MSRLDHAVRYDTLVARGATDLYGEEQVRRWTGGREELTVAELLDVHAPPGVVFWAVLREHVVGEQVLHRIAVDVAAEFLRRHREQGAYVDFRTDRGLEAKTRWLEGQISAGELLVHAEHARRAATDVTAHEDPRVWAVAQVVRRALDEHGESAVSGAYYTFLDTFDTPADHAWLVERVRQRLAE